MYVLFVNKQNNRYHENIQFTQSKCKYISKKKKLNSK